MNQKFKTAAVLTIAAMIIYVVTLAVMQYNGTLPVETTVYVTSPNIAIEMPFEVSYWYGLIFFPAVLMMLGVYTSLETYVGKEPRDGNFAQDIKYQARQLSVFVPALSIGIGMGTGAISVLVGPFLSDVGGPISALANTIVVSLACYLFFAVGITAVMMVIHSLNYYDAKDGYKPKMHSMTEAYLQFSAQLFKNSGFMLGSPLLVGCTLGYMVRLIAHTAAIATSATIKMVLPGKAAKA